MSWRHISTDTTTAPRNLTRATAVEVTRHSRWGMRIAHHPKPEPSIGGVAEKTHHTWKHKCGAYAVTADDEQGKAPPTKCGKCGS